MLATLFLGLLLLTSLPAFQAWSARTASEQLSRFLGTQVEVGNLRIGLLGRLILDDVRLYDRRDTLMLEATRMAAKLNYLPLLEGKIRIDNGQFFGLRAVIYRDGEEAPNYQFLVDAFSSDNTDRKPVDLGIGALVIRRGEVRYDRLDLPETPGQFCPNHLHVRDLSLTARIHVAMPDTLSIDLRHLSMQEVSGFMMDKLSFEAALGQHGANVRNFRLQLPSSHLEMPLLAASYEGLDSTIIRKLKADVSIHGELSPFDLRAFSGKVADFEDAIQFSVKADTHDGNIRIPELELFDWGENFSLSATGSVQHFMDSPVADLHILQLKTGPHLQQYLTQNLRGEAVELSPILTRLGSAESTGQATYADHTLTAEITTKTAHGSVSLQGQTDLEHIQASARAEALRLGYLLSGKEDAPLGDVTAEVSADGSLPRNGKPIHLSAEGNIESLVFKGYEYKNTHLTAAVRNKDVDVSLSLEGLNGTVHASAQSPLKEGQRALQCCVEVQDFAPYNLNLTKKYEGERFSGIVEADLSCLDPDVPEGNVQIRDFCIVSDEGDRLAPGDLSLVCSTEDGIQHVALDSRFAQFRADGLVRWTTLSASFLHPLSQSLPSLLGRNRRTDTVIDNDFRFSASIQDTLLLSRLIGTDIKLPEHSTIEGLVSDPVCQVALQLHVPEITIGSQQLLNIDCRAESNPSSVQTSLQFNRMMKDTSVEINLDAFAKDDKVNTRLRWDNRQPVAQRGDVNLVSAFKRDLDDKLMVDARFNPSEIIIRDTTWHVHPALVQYHDKVVDVSGFKVNNGERHLMVHGRASALQTDTLTAELQNIDLTYIFDLINFHTVDFAGYATGSAYATALMDKPVVNGFVQVQPFTFNTADFGTLDVHVNWGDHDKAITLDAAMSGNHPLHRTTVNGTVTPGQGPGTGLELMIRTNHADLSFLNKYTHAIFRDFAGRGSGWVRVFGPFKQVNLEGDLVAHALSTHVLAIGTDYHIGGGDSVIFRPDNIWIPHATLYDRYGAPGKAEHSAKVDVHLMHHYMKDMSYDVNIETNNLLGYDFPTGDERSYYGTIYADANVHLDGKPGSVNIDVSGTPRKGTILTYNVASRGTLTETDFITYVSHTDSLHKQEETAEEEQTANDMRMNFDLDLTPEAELCVLMDARSGDNILLNGNGRIRAHFYNKGRFQMYGTYHVDGGTYKMSFRDVIRKDFSFRPDGSIIFGGDPYQAALNLQAVYTVPNVSLEDLSATSLGLSNTRVDCIMNIGGRAKAPMVTFDFDVPNVGEDEKQMVRSMISTEEERNLQVVYLLGLGRFYSYGAQYAGAGTQSTAAANSFISSTISSRFNQLMSQVLGSSNWSFGTNLRTGQTGWDQVDVEGMLSGRLLNNRLIINGNIGYRESMYNMNRNTFIGDFDILYRLTPHGSFSLKAYSQTNDRYFTQSSLTTQGIGIQFQRDFTRFKEAFRRVRSSKKEQKKSK